jgi:hypothetical protein
MKETAKSTQGRVSTHDNHEAAGALGSSREVPRRSNTGRWWSAAAALAAALVFAAPVAAQDVPWGHKSDSKKTTKKSAKKAAAKKTDAKKAAANSSSRPAAAAKNAAANAAQKNVAPVQTADVPAAEEPAKPKAELVQVDLIEHFKTELAPHGKWLTDETHGDVWVPNPATVGTDWAPYRDHGHWAVTDEGDWAWVSDMAWGKIPFHYGRWAWSPEKNWMWKPGTEHAPAWVVWRVADDNRKFVGWAPMAPESTGEAKTVLPFYFAPTRYLFSPHIDKFIIANPRLGKKMFDQSHVYGGHTAPAPVATVTDKAADPAAADPAAADPAAADPAAADPAAADEAATQPSATKKATKRVLAGGTAPEAPKPAGLRAASPSFAEVKVPVYAMPKTTLPSTDESVAPIAVTLREKEPPAAPDDVASTETNRFATPPPNAAGNSSKITPRRSLRARPLPRKRTVKRGWSRRDARGDKPRYRCFWTNTRPRIWRCGY